MTTQDNFKAFETVMHKAGLSGAAIRAFRHSYDSLASGSTGLLPEKEIQPVDSLPRMVEVTASIKPDSTLLGQAVVLKLNGGLGTGMGLEKAKSLLEIKNGLTFLDFIAKQVLWLRKKNNAPLRFMLMNSFSTSKDTLAFLEKYPELGGASELELMQGMVPKVNAATLQPMDWPANRDMEWCPPGHGDLFPSLLGSGWLDKLLKAGFKYLFASNSDNLGASLDPALLTYFAKSESPFLMEVCERTVSDRKGGHLARRDGRLLLRESAQCPEADLASFQDIARHKFFNTNNLWIRLDHLKKLLDAKGGFIPLPVIRNSKTVDPRDKTSPKVIQLETAMGAAIECFDNAGAVVVPRSRFAPVKTTGDLMALRSDAYDVTEDWRLELSKKRSGTPPNIDLDGDHYKMVDQLDAALTGGVPSLAECDELVVRGPVRFSANTKFVGKVSIKSAAPKTLPAGEYINKTLQLD